MDSITALGKSLSIPISKKLVRLDVIGTQTSNASNTGECKHIFLNEHNQGVRTDLYDVLQHDYTTSMNFGDSDTLTYTIINGFGGVLCQVNSSETSVFIHFPEPLCDHNQKLLSVFYDHVNSAFVFDAILADKSFLNMTLPLHVFGDSNPYVNARSSFKYSILPSPIEEEHVPASFYQLNNHANVVTLKYGGLVLCFKITEEDVVVEYRNKVYGKTERRTRFESLYIAFRGKKTNNFIIPNTEYLGSFINSVVLLPENRIAVLTDKLDLVLLQLQGFDSPVSDLPEESLKLELLSKINILETYVSDWTVGLMNTFVEARAQINLDCSTFVFYMPNRNGNYLLAKLDYDIQSVENSNLSTSLSGFKYLEGETERFTTLNADFELIDYKTGSEDEVFCLLKSKTFLNQTKNEFVVMKYYNDRWTTTFHDQISKVNHLEQLGTLDVTTLNDEQALDLALTFGFCYGINYKQFYDSDGKLIFKNKQDWFAYVQSLKEQHFSSIGEPCSLSLLNSNGGLLSVDLKKHNPLCKDISSFYLPAFKLPFEDGAAFFKMIKNVCQNFTMSEDSLGVSKLVREFMKEDPQSIDIDLLKSKYEFINIEEFVLFLNSASIDQIIASLKALVAYEITIDPTTSTVNNKKQEHILLDYVYYKNHQLMMLYLDIILCFKSIDINDAALIDVLKQLLASLIKRFKFDNCYKFNKDVLFEIFINQKASLNLKRVENFVAASEFLLNNVLINEYETWNLQYQLHFLQNQNISSFDMHRFVEFIEAYSYDPKVKNIALLQAFEFDKTIENCLFETKRVDVGNNTASYDSKTLSLLATESSFEYLTCLLTVFIDFYKDLTISDKLAKIIVDNFINSNENLTSPCSKLIFYKYYIKLISEHGKFKEIIEILLTTDSLLNPQDKYQIYSELLGRFGTDYLRAIIKYNYREQSALIPFNQFDIVKQIVFAGIKSKNGFVLFDYVKLLLSYEDKRGALKILYYLLTEAQEESKEAKANYKNVLLSVLYTLPKEDRWVLDYSGKTVGIDDIPGF